MSSSLRFSMRALAFPLALAGPLCSPCDSPRCYFLAAYYPRAVLPYLVSPSTFSTLALRDHKVQTLAGRARHSCCVRDRNAISGAVMAHGLTPPPLPAAARRFQYLLCRYTAFSFCGLFWRGGWNGLTEDARNG